MLNETQQANLWYDILAAQVRSLYFADLGADYTKRKQFISGASFFLASGAAATASTHLPLWIPIVLSTFTAVLMAYSIAVNLDQKAMTMAKLHFVWDQIETDRAQLWDHWYEENAESRLREIESREQAASQSAVTDAPYNAKLLKKWQTFVYDQRQMATAFDKATSEVAGHL